MCQWCRSGSTVSAFSGNYSWVDVLLGDTIEVVLCNVIIYYRPPHLGRQQDLKVEQKHYKASVCVVRQILTWSMRCSGCVHMHM